MNIDGKRSQVNLVGYEWEDALQEADRHGLRLEQAFTAAPRGGGHGPLRIVQQRWIEGRLHCTCAAEDWGEAPC